MFLAPEEPSRFFTKMENGTSGPAQKNIANCIEILKEMGLNMTTKEINMPNVRINIQINVFLSMI